jgi:hypothetical protein
MSAPSAAGATTDSMAGILAVLRRGGSSWFVRTHGRMALQREFPGGRIEDRIYRQMRRVRFNGQPGYDFVAADRGLIRDLAAGKLL